MTAFNVFLTGSLSVYCLDILRSGSRVLVCWWPYIFTKLKHAENKPKRFCVSVNCMRILVFSCFSILEWLLSVDTSSRLSPCSVESICCIFTQFVLISSHLLSKLIYVSLIHISHCFIVQ